MCPIRIRTKALLIFSLLALIFFECTSSSKISQGDDCKKCDLKTATSVSGKAEMLTYQEVNEFLCTLDSSCKNNVEFSEVSNEVLFQVLLNKPEFVLRALTENGSLSTDFILLQLTQPISDRIDLKSVQAKVLTVKAHQNVREKVLKSLQDAIAKY